MLERITAKVTKMLERITAKVTKTSEKNNKNVGKVSKSSWVKMYREPKLICGPDQNLRGAGFGPRALSLTRVM